MLRYDPPNTHFISIEFYCLCIITFHRLDGDGGGGGGGVLSYKYSIEITMTSHNICNEMEKCSKINFHSFCRKDCENKSKMFSCQRDTL